MVKLKYAYGKMQVGPRDNGKMTTGDGKHATAPAQRAFSIIEVLVVLAVMTLLATVLVPNMAGFLKGGKEKAYGSDRETLQLAVDAWRNTVGKTVGPSFPVLQCGEEGPCVGGNIDLSQQCLGFIDGLGNPSVPNCNPYVDFQALADEQFLRNASSTKSAKTSRNTTATNSPTGSYGWFVNTGGLVDSFPSFQEGLFP